MDVSSPRSNRELQEEVERDGAENERYDPAEADQTSALKRTAPSISTGNLKNAGCDAPDGDEDNQNQHDELPEQSENAGPDADQSGCGGPPSRLRPVLTQDRGGDRQHTAGDRIGAKHLESEVGRPEHDPADRRRGSRSVHRRQPRVSPKDI